MAEGHAHKGHRHGHGEQRSGVAVGVLTCSDRSARGERADVGGPTVHNLVLDRIPGAKVTQYKVVPDDREQISSTLIAWADDERLDLILTTGGTGLAPRDITPEATHAVIDRAVPAFPLAMLFESLRMTPYAMLTRAAAGIRGQTLIINLPGNPKAIQENLDAIIEVLPHAVQIVRGEDTHAEGGGGQKDHADHDEGHGGHREHQAEHDDHAESAHGHEQHGGGEHREHEPAAAPAERGGIARNVGGPPC
jgi:molybdenum cofactor synthesis domain-containing protein